MNNPNPTTKLLPVLIAALTLSLHAARAADIYWTNTLGGNWSDALNWSPNQAPNTGDNAFITQAGTYTVTVNVAVFINSLIAGAASGTQTVAVVYTLALNTNTVVSSRVVLNLVGGGLFLSGETTVNSPINWTGGTIQGPGVLNANGGMAISGSGDKQLYAGTLNNGGNVTWAGSGVLYVGAGAVINNPAGRLFDVQTDSSVSYSGNPLPTFNNAGTFRKSAGPGTNSFSFVSFNNSGTIDIQSGTLSFGYGGRQDGRLQVSTGATVVFSGGLFSFGAGNTNGITGTFQVSGGAVSVDTNVTAVLPNLTLSGGQMRGDGTWTVNGLMNWTSGVIDGAGVLNANGGMAISGSANKYLYYRTVNNGGTVTWTGSGHVVTGFGAILNNPAGRLFDIQNDSQIIYGWAPTTINNAGTFRKSAGTGTTYIGVALNNTGTVEVEAGTLDLTSPFRQRSGALLLKGGNVDSSNVGSLQIGGGLLGGSGKVLRGLTVSGQLSPGLSAGRVEVLGNYTQPAAGSYNVEIGGTIAGTNYDQVAVTGYADLHGSINVISINGFVPAPGDRFEIMKFASKSGSVTFQGLDITNGISLLPVFSATNLVLVATNAPLRAAPKMNLARNGDSLWLWWPLGYSGFNVQSTTNLNAPIAWSPVTPAEVNRHTFQSTEPKKFYRMIKP